MSISDTSTFPAKLVIKKTFPAKIHTRPRAYLNHKESNIGSTVLTTFTIYHVCMSIDITQLWRDEI
jgi:hypothetical protein